MTPKCSEIWTKSPDFASFFVRVLLGWPVGVENQSQLGSNSGVRGLLGWSVGRASGRKCLFCKDLRETDTI